MRNQGHWRPIAMLITALLVITGSITLVVMVAGGGSQEGALNASMVEEGAILVNNHTGAEVKILRVEDVVTPYETYRVVVYLVLSGPGSEVLVGEQRWELNDFVQHHHVGDGGARASPSSPSPSPSTPIMAAFFW